MFCKGHPGDLSLSLRLLAAEKNKAVPTTMRSMDFGGTQVSNISKASSITNRFPAMIQKRSLSHPEHFPGTCIPGLIKPTPGWIRPESPFTSRTNLNQEKNRVQWQVVVHAIVDLRSFNSLEFILPSPFSNFNSPSKSVFFNCRTVFRCGRLSP